MFDKVNPGDILYSSGGYNRIIVDFYKVTEKIGKATLVLQKLGRKIVSGNEESGEVVADPEVNVGNTFKTRIGKNGRVHGQYKSERLSYWTGSPEYFNNFD